MSKKLARRQKPIIFMLNGHWSVRKPTQQTNKWAYEQAEKWCSEKRRLPKAP